MLTLQGLTDLLLVEADFEWFDVTVILVAFPLIVHHDQRRLRARLANHDLVQRGQNTLPHFIEGDPIEQRLNDC